jgi:hypothetical protein
VGEAIKQPKLLDVGGRGAGADHRPEAGATKAKKSIANFGLREGRRSARR